MAKDRKKRNLKRMMMRKKLPCMRFPGNYRAWGPQQRANTNETYFDENNHPETFERVTYWDAECLAVYVTCDVATKLEGLEGISNRDQIYTPTRIRRWLRIHVLKFWQTYKNFSRGWQISSDHMCQPLLTLRHKPTGQNLLAKTYWPIPAPQVVWLYIRENYVPRNIVPLAPMTQDDQSFIILHFL